MDILDDDITVPPARSSRSIEDVIASGYTFNFGDYFTRMFQLFGKTWGWLLGQSGILLATYLLIYGIMVAMLFSTISDAALSSGNSRKPEDAMAMMKPMLTIMLVVMAIITVWMLAFVMPLRAGTYVFLNNGLNERKYSFNDFFNPIRTKWLKLLGLVIIWFITSFLCAGIAYWYWLKDMPGFFDALSVPDSKIRDPFVMYKGMGWIWLSYVPVIFFQVCFSLAIPLLVLQTNSIGKALISSMRIVLKKWFLFFALYLLVYVMTIIGVFACGIGLLLTIHFFPLCIYAIYEDIFIRQNQTT